MILIDKGYFDYDFQKAPERKAERKEKSREELQNILAGFGFSQFKKTEEEIQEHILKHMED